MTNFDAEDKLQHALTLMAAKAVDPKKIDQDDDEGGTTTTGSGGVVVEKVLFAEVFGLQRASEKQFGVVGDFDPIAYAAEAAKVSQEKSELGQAAKGTLKAHPILSKLAKFAGDTDKMSMNPQENAKAQERNEHRLNLRMSLKNKPNSTPTPKPGGL